MNALITTLKGWYASHGTRIIGYFTTAYGALQIALGAISASPDFRLLVTPKEFALLAVLNTVLGALTIRRGFTNAKTA
jgi:hypothetical protein